MKTPSQVILIVVTILLGGWFVYWFRWELARTLWHWCPTLDQQAIALPAYVSRRLNDKWWSRRWAGKCTGDRLTYFKPPATAMHWRSQQNTRTTKQSPSRQLNRSLALKAAEHSNSSRDATSGRYCRRLWATLVLGNLHHFQSLSRVKTKRWWKKKKKTFNNKVAAAHATMALSLLPRSISIFAWRNRFYTLQIDFARTVTAPPIP